MTGLGIGERRRRRHRMAVAKKKWSRKRVGDRTVVRLTWSEDGDILAEVKCASGHEDTIKATRLKCAGSCRQCNPARKTMVGERYGTRVIVARDLIDAARVTALCDCGAMSETTYRAMREGAGCRACMYGSGAHKPIESYRRPDVVAKLKSLAEEFPWMLDDTKEAAQAVSVVVDLFGPMLTEEVSFFLGVSRQAVNLTEHEAQESFRAALARDEQTRHTHVMSRMGRRTMDRTIYARRDA